jgi:hypothetical protein
MLYLDTFATVDMKLTLHIPLPIKDDERITLALSLFILDDPDPLDCAVHFEFSAEVLFRDFFGLRGG